MLSTDQVERIVATTAATVGSAAASAAGLTPEQTRIVLLALDAGLRQAIAAATRLDVEAQTVRVTDVRPDRKR